VPVRRLNSLIWRQRIIRGAPALIDRAIDADKPDFFAMTNWSDTACAWCEACRSRDVPYVLFTHGLELVEDVSAALAQRRLADVLGATRVAANSQATADILLGMGLPKDKLLMVLPGVSPDRLPPLGEKEFERSLATMDLGNRRFVLAMGRLVKRKGFDWLVRAFAEVAGEFPDVDLIIAGGGNEFETIKRASDEAALGDRIRLLGRVDDTQRIALLQGCELFAMPNRPLPGDMEGFGIVFLEAALFAKATIGGNNGGVPDAVADGETGLLVDTSSSHQPLAEALRRLLSDRDYTRKLGRQGRERTLGRFTWQSVARRLSDQLFG